MAAKPLALHPAALEEAKSAVQWYLERSETAARKFTAALDEALDRIIESPDRWPIDTDSTHKFVLRRFPFAVIYRERENAIAIIAIAHGHRRPRYWKARL
jgi:toxin ParE1/3/4